MYDEYYGEEELVTRQDLNNLVSQVGKVMVENELSRQLREKDSDLADGGIKQELVQFHYRRTNPNKSASQRLDEAIAQTKEVLQGGAASQEPSKHKEENKQTESVSVNTESQGQDGKQYILDRKQRQVEKASHLY